MMLNYTVTYKKVKNITLRITADGQLLVTAPRHTSKTAIEKVVEQKADWIVHHQQKIAQLQAKRQQEGLHNLYQDGGQIGYLGQQYPEALCTAYKLPQLPARETEENDVAWGYRLLCAAGKKRGFLISGGEVDTERMAKILLDEFRGGKLGRFTLELPEDVR